MKAIIIRANGFVGTIDVPNKLETLQELVGGYIEVVNISEKHCFISNEEGKLLGLPVNRKATTLLRNLSNTSDYIVGDVLVAGVNEDEFVDVKVSSEAFLDYME